MARLSYGTYIDITGKRYGMLTVLEFSHFGPPPKQKNKGRRTYWLCECDCGKQVIRRKDSLSTQRNTIYLSCGCMHRELNRQRFVKEHAMGFNPSSTGDDHWTRKDPIRAKEVGIKNLGEYIKPKNKGE